MFQFDIRRLDIYRRVPTDLTQPTRTGAVISIAAVVFCFYLLIAEFLVYMEPQITSEVYVDDPVKAHEFIPVSLNISLYNLPCDRVGLDTQDDMGRYEMGMADNVLKKKLSDGAGCLLESTFRIAKVSGNFHVSTHASDSRGADNASPLNLAHTIHELSFGHEPSSELSSAFHQISSFAPLNGRSVRDTADWVSQDYFLKIVPSIFDGPGFRQYPFQFTSLYRSMPKDDLPQGQAAIYFRYEMAPIVVQYRTMEKPFYHFLTQACAIIGGAFTVSGIVDSMIFSASQVLVKARLGKLP